VYIIQIPSASRRQSVAHITWCSIGPHGVVARPNDGKHAPLSATAIAAVSGISACRAKRGVFPGVGKPKNGHRVYFCFKGHWRNPVVRADPWPFAECQFNLRDKELPLVLSAKNEKR
jgi:hypothetical protein